MPRPLVALLALALPAGFAAADERADAVKKQKAAAQANVEASKLTFASAETDDLLVYAALPEDKTKAAAGVFQKAFASAVKGLKVEAADKLWPGKLTVYVVPASRDYKAFLLASMKRKADDVSVTDVRADPPFVVQGAAAGDKPTDARVTEQAAGLVAAAVLAKQAGTGSLPPWLASGFGQVTYLRADGNAAKLADFRAKSRGLLTKTRGAAFKLATLTDAAESADRDVVAASLAEYLAYGPGASKFQGILDALKPSEDNQNPTLEKALEAAEWKAWDLEQAWQKWVQTGK